MERISIFLITVALIAGMVSCGGGGGEYDLTITSTVGGSVTTPGEGTFTRDAGTVVNLAAAPASGYRFVNWTGDVDDIADVEDATTTITMQGDCEIIANFEAIPAGQYSLTISSTAGGSVTMPSEGVFTYDEGTVVDLVAEAEEGYHFVNWTGDVNTIGNVEATSTTIIMNDNHSITANFEELPEHDLTISSTAGGSVTSPGEGTFTRDAGTVVNLAAAPASGYRFINWTGNVGTIANVNAATTTIIMNGDYSITANFADVNPADVVVANTNCTSDWGTYNITFNVTGDLVTGTTTITIEFPSGTDLTNVTTITVINAVSGTATVPATWITITGETVTFYSPVYVVPLLDPVVSVIFPTDRLTHGITNPPAGTYTLDVSTSAPVDATPVASNPYTILP